MLIRRRDAVLRAVLLAAGRSASATSVKGPYRVFVFVPQAEA